MVLQPRHQHLGACAGSTTPDTCCASRGRARCACCELLRVGMIGLIASSTPATCKPIAASSVLHDHVLVQPVKVNDYARPRGYRTLRTGWPSTLRPVATMLRTTRRAQVTRSSAEHTQTTPQDTSVPRSHTGPLKSDDTSHTCRVHRRYSSERYGHGRSCAGPPFQLRHNGRRQVRLWRSVTPCRP